MKTRMQLVHENERLADRVKELEAALAFERQKVKQTAFINAASLPPCESLACIGCEHYVCLRVDHDGIYPLGCGKNVDCPDFKRRRDTLSEQERQSLQRAMLLQEQS